MGIPQIGSPQIGYVNVFTKDLKRAVAFYRDALGLSLAFEHEEFGYASFGAGAVTLGIAQLGDEDESASLPGRHTGIGFVVADLDAAHRELEAKGVRFETPPTRQPWGGYMATFADPDGNRFYLDQLRDE